MSWAKRQCSQSGFSLSISDSLLPSSPGPGGLGFVFVACSVSGLSVKMYTVRWNGLAGDIYICAVLCVSGRVSPFPHSCVL